MSSSPVFTKKRRRIRVLVHIIRVMFLTKINIVYYIHWSSLFNTHNVQIRKKRLDPSKAKQTFMIKKMRQTVRYGWLVLVKLISIERPNDKR